MHHDDGLKEREVRCSEGLKTCDNHPGAIGIFEAARCHASATLDSAVALPVGCRVQDSLLVYRKGAPGIRVYLKASEWLVMSHRETLRLTSLSAFCHSSYWLPRYSMLSQWTRPISQVPN